MKQTSAEKRNEREKNKNYELITGCILIEKPLHRMYSLKRFFSRKRRI